MLLELAWLLGVLTLGLLSPGPDFLLVVKNSMGGSRARALGTAVGISTGLSVHVLLISFGLAALHPAYLRVIQYIGVALLGTIGLRALLARPPADGPVASSAAPLTAHSGFIERLLCNVTNPKAFVFFVSLFAQVVRPGAPDLWRFALPITVVLHGFVCWALIVLALQSPLVTRRLGRMQHWLTRAFGGALVLVALGVLIEAVRETLRS